MAATRASKTKKPFYKDLLYQVLFGIVAGIVFGYIYPEKGAALKPLGDAFINLIKMMIAPIIFCTLVAGIAGMGNMKQVGRVGFWAVICFEITTTLALFIGLALVLFFEPGSTLNIDVTHLDTGAIQEKIAHAAHGTMLDFLMGLIPTTLVSAFSSGEILQVLLVSLFFAAGLARLKEKGKPVIATIESFSHVLFKMVDIITLFAPIGAFGAMAYTVGKFGVGSLKELSQLIFLFYLTCALFVLLVLAPVMRFYCKLSTLQFLRFFKEELSIVLGTSSSESVLPQMIEKLTYLGCSRPVVGMVIPAGYSFNLIGSCIYFTMGALFITYATHTPLTGGQIATILTVLLITSKGAAGVTGSAFLVLAATLTSMVTSGQLAMSQETLNVGLALIFAVDRFMSTGRAITNLIGNGITTIIVAKWENALDVKRAQDVLSGKIAAYEYDAG